MSPILCLLTATTVLTAILSQFSNYTDDCSNEDDVCRFEMSSLEASRTSEDKIRKLLDLLTRKSVAHYKTFIDCLEMSSQQHVAQILRTNAGLSYYYFYYYYYYYYHYYYYIINLYLFRLYRLS